MCGIINVQNAVSCIATSLTVYRVRLVAKGEMDPNASPYYDQTYFPIARVFRRGAMWISMYVCINMQACKTTGSLGACVPNKFLEMKCSEIASEASLE